MWFVRGLAGFSVLAFSTIVALAANQACYRPDDMEAEQGVRYMTELMVVNDTCKQHIYETFIQHNRAALTAYHAQLLQHYRGAGDRRAEDTLDRWVTHVANDTAMAIGAVPVATLCAGKAAFFATADALAGESFHGYIVALANQHQQEYRRCAEPRAAGAK
ncbi:MAG TPA: hypothetical protein VFC38_11700 [Stellaceae bacterium]|nr:hypothetical protein [Stellaceae bacterium]